MLKFMRARYRSSLNIITTTGLNMDRWFVLALTCLLTQVYSANPPQTITCPPGTLYIPHPSDCSAYFLCAYRKPRFMLCSAGLEFSPTTKTCEDPSVAKCNKFCDALVSDAKGTWNPPSCSAGLNKVGSVCSITCAKDLELRGSSSINCIDSGWNSTNGNLIPKCVELDCFSEDMKNTINGTLSVKSGMLFVLDESGSVGSIDFVKSKNFVKDIVNAFPLSASRTAGVITFDDYPIVRIHLSEASTTRFTAQVDSIPYRGQGTDVLEALEGALQEIQRINPASHYLVILITDGISETDATPAANALKKLDHPVFAIGVGQTRLAYVESLSSMGNNGIRHFFHTRNYDILKSIGTYINRPPGAATAATQKKCA